MRFGEPMTAPEFVSPLLDRHFHLDEHKLAAALATARHVVDNHAMTFSRQATTPSSIHRDGVWLGLGLFSRHHRSRHHRHRCPLYQYARAGLHYLLQPSRARCCLQRGRWASRWQHPLLQSSLAGG